jgi:protein-tyrosine phosphatase
MFELIDPPENLDNKHRPLIDSKVINSRVINSQNSRVINQPIYNQPINFLPKEISEVSNIIKNLYLSGKYGEQFYDKFDVIINLNYPENNAPKGCLMIDKSKIYKLGIEDAVFENLYPYFDLLASLIITSLKENKTVLVHCHAGISRSTSIIVAFFIKYGNMSLQDALKKIHQKRNIIQPNQSFLKQLDHYSKKHNKHKN